MSALSRFFPLIITNNFISWYASSTTQTVANDLIHNKTLSYLKKEKRKQLWLKRLCCPLHLSNCIYLALKSHVDQSNVTVNKYEWVSDCCLTPGQLNHCENNLNFCKIITISALYQTSMLSLIFIVLAHWNYSPRIDMSSHSDTLSWFRENQYLLFLLNGVCLTVKYYC